MAGIWPEELPYEERKLAARILATVSLRRPEKSKFPLARTGDAYTESAPLASSEQTAAQTPNHTHNCITPPAGDVLNRRRKIRLCHETIAPVRPAHKHPGGKVAVRWR